MRKCMSFFFIWITLALVQIVAYEHCNTANTSSIENTDTCTSQEYTYIVSLKDLLFDNQRMFINLDDMFFSVSTLELIGNQWLATVDFGKNAGYCQRGHDLCSKCELCHKEGCWYYVKPCWER